MDNQSCGSLPLRKSAKAECGDWPLDPSCRDKVTLIPYAPDSLYRGIRASRVMGSPPCDGSEWSFGFVPPKTGTRMSLPRFGGQLTVWPQAPQYEVISSSSLTPFFCSAPGRAILPSRPAGVTSRRAQPRSRTAPWGRPKGLSLYGAFEVKHTFHAILHFLHSSFFVRL